MRRHRTLPSLAALALAAATAGSLDDGRARAESRDEEEESEHDGDPLALASLLITGGDLERARAVLDALRDDETVDQARRARLLGHVLLRLGDVELAYRTLDEAVRGGERGESVLVERARAAHQASLHRETLAALDDVGPRARSDAALVRMRARAFAALDDDGAALLTLRAYSARTGALDGEGAGALVVDEVRLLAERGLFVEASDVLTAALPALTRDDALAAYDALSRAESSRDAATRARLVLAASALHARFSYDERAALSLARALADDEKPLAGALVLEPHARRHRARALDVAELYRRAGHGESALSWNASAPDGQEKLRQRFSILVDARRFEAAAALAPRLAARGLASDPDVAYALGYALFVTGRIDEAERTLRAISDPRRFADASALMASIASCRREVHACP